MNGWRRRSVLKTAAAAAGGSVVGRARGTDADEGEGDGVNGRRYIVDTRDLPEGRLDDADLEVIHSLDPVDLAVVRGREDAVRELGAPYEPDLRLSDDDGARTQVVEAAGQFATVDETLYPAQWDKQAQNLSEAHSVTRGEGTRVAVIDDGVQADHPDLRHAVNLELSRSFVNDEYGSGAAYGGNHGTMVSGVIAAASDDQGVVGTAPATEIVDCRVFRHDTFGSNLADILAAVVYSADLGCDVANLSLAPPLGLPQRVAALNRLASSRVAAYARERGTLLVAASGNDGVDLEQVQNTLFENTDNIVITSATGPIGFGWPIEDHDGDGLFSSVDELESTVDLIEPYHDPAFYSNYGAGIIDLSAPGGNLSQVARVGSVPGWYLDFIPTTDVTVTLDQATGTFRFESGYGWTVGTSFAAPQVAGAAALVRSIDPSLTPIEIRETLQRTATEIEGEDARRYHGAGFLNPARAVTEE